MDDELRRLLGSMIDRIDTLVPRIDAIGTRLDVIDTRLDAVTKEARGAREGTEQLKRLVSVQADQLRTLSDGVATIAVLQGHTSRTLGDLVDQVARLVEGNARGRTNDAQRYGDLEARVAELEVQMRALAAGQGH